MYPRRGLTARLACVRHAASVHSEPGSNSPVENCYRRRDDGDMRVRVLSIVGPSKLVRRRPSVGITRSSFQRAPSRVGLTILGRRGSLVNPWFPMAPEARFPTPTAVGAQPYGRGVRLSTPRRELFGRRSGRSVEVLPRTQLDGWNSARPGPRAIQSRHRKGPGGRRAEEARRGKSPKPGGSWWISRQGWRAPRRELRGLFPRADLKRPG